MVKNNDKIKYYCFNTKCKSSIFYADTCLVVEVLLCENLSNDRFCQECFKELISKHDLNIKIQLNQLLNEAKLYKSLIIDDDPDYHTLADTLFENSSTFNELKHYTDGNIALDYLSENKNKADVMPDFIFVDVNMPKMDGWEFLAGLKKIYPYFKKQVSVYIISSQILPLYREKLKKHPYAKGLISKNFDLGFLNNVSN